MKRVVLILFLVLLVPNGKVLIGQVDGCLKMVYPNNWPTGEYTNPDSIMVDTCRQSLTYGKWYAKRGYFFVQKIYIFGDKIRKGTDTLTWKDISSTFTQIKEQFHTLEDRFGKYKISRSIHGAPTDSSQRLSPVWDLEFETYYAVDTICNAINSIDSTICGGVRIEPTILYSVFESTKTDSLLIIDNLNENYLRININENLLLQNNTVSIFNLNGILMFSLPIIYNNTIIIDIGSWGKGVYIIKIKDFSKKFIIR